MNFQLPDFGKIFVISLILFTIWFFAIDDMVTPLIQQDFAVGYLIFVVVYSALVIMYMVKDNSGQTSIHPLKNPKLFAAFILAFFLSDLFMYPYLVEREAQPALTAAASISSDIYIYKLLPVDLPEIMKYFIVYPLTLSVGFTLIALLTQRKREFANVVGRAL